jgi:uncharacterized protein YbjQ (UPF0145 family)
VNTCHLYIKKDHDKAFLISLFTLSLTHVFLMPCILKVKVVAGRDLPVMDRKSELTDAYVEIRYADFEPQRTEIARKTLSPTWNEDFRYEVSDEPLELRVLDYDAITANDEIGVVTLDLNPLLSKELSGQLAGWFPIYDTLRGVRGELHVQVRLQFFGDVNPFKDSSAGLKFLSAACLPPAGLSGVVSLGFVDAMATERDPEYHWSDNFRTPRASNAARQRLLYRLSGRLRRTLGVKVLDLGGNAVVGYRHWFDFEREEGIITARAIGCAVRLGLDNGSATNSLTNFMQNISMTHERMSLQDVGESSSAVGSSSPIGVKGCVETQTTSSFDPDAVSLSMGSSLHTTHARTRTKQRRTNSILSTDVHSLKPFGFSMAEEGLLAVDAFEPGAILRLGGMVAARSVKITDTNTAAERGAWWEELREEVRAHARTLGCNTIVGYTETTAIHDDIYVLSAMGTAVMMDKNTASLYHGNASLPNNECRSPIEPTSPHQMNNGIFKQRRQRQKRISGKLYYDKVSLYS